MRFKDKIKALRRERNLTQKELGEEIFVSRSAVAKWENGLGLPSRASYEALLDFFGVSETVLPLNEEEEAPKIRRRIAIHIVCGAVSWTLILALALAPLLLMYAVMNGYGFTSKMAAGKYFADNEVISTDGYDFYVSYFSDTDENGENVYLGISSFVAVEKRIYGYQSIRDNKDYRRIVFDENAVGDANDKRYGILYSFPADNCCYNIFRSTITLLGPIESDQNGASVPVDQNIISEIYVNGEKVDLTYGSFFVTEKTVTEFEVLEYSDKRHLLTVK